MIYKVTLFKLFLLFFIIFTYVVGFLFRENLAGGAERDFLAFTWPAILSFKKNFFLTLQNYGQFGEGSTPLFHILNAYLNPFSSNQIIFQGSIAFISLLNVLFFSQILKEKFRLNGLDAVTYSSIFLILPFFRSSAFWGLTENLGWLFLILAIKYYNKIEYNKKNSALTIFLVCFFSSFALYTRPYLIFFPIFFIIYLMFYKRAEILKYASLFYLILALPGFYLIFLWGGIFKLGGVDPSLYGPNIAQTSLTDYHNPKFILKNIVIFSSIFLFYLIPFKLSQYYLSRNELVKKKDYLIFLLIFAVLIFLSFINIFDYLNNEKLGGGAFLRLNQLIFKDSLIPFLFLCSLGLLLIYKYATISKKNLILISSLLIFCLPKFILQEYFEPLIIIIFLSLLDYEENYIKLLKNDKTQFICLLYFIAYFFSSFVYRNYINPLDLYYYLNPI